jgi:hypothetical protein
MNENSILNAFLSASTKASIGPLPSPSIVSVEPSALRSVATSSRLSGLLGMTSA